MAFRKVSSLIFIASLVPFNSLYAADSITIKNAWSPEAPPVANVMAGYMQMYNNTDKDLVIKSLKSKLFNRVEIHLTKIKKGVARMTQQRNITIKAKRSILLEPGSLHMMLIGKSQAITIDSVIDVTLTLDNGETINIKLKVKADNIH